MVEAEEAKNFVVETCTKVITTLSEENNIENLKIRIDLENKKAKPVFGLFDNSTLHKRCSLRDIIHAGGGKGMGMILNVYVKKMLKDIFFQTMKRLEFTDTKLMFVLLYLNEADSVTFPTISIYKDGVCIETMPIAEVIAASDNPM